MANRINITEMLDRLESDNPRSRDIAAAELGDLLEADYLNKREFKKTVKVLIRSALSEIDRDAKESMFNSLYYASSSPYAAELNWREIASALDRLDYACLADALVILGFAAGVAYKDRIECYLTHLDRDVRDAASEALAEIEWRSKRPAKQRLGRKNRA